MLEQCSSCLWHFYHWSASSGEVITPLEVHEYNEGFYQLNMHRIETEYVRVVCESCHLS